MLPKLSRVPLVLLAGLVLAACQDPSGVGLSLIDDEASDPNTRLLATDSLYVTEQSEPTGGFADGSGTPTQTRILLGAFTDGLLGDTRATAYADARQEVSSTAFDERTLDQVKLELVRAEIVGDTLATIPYEIRQVDPVAGRWNPEGLPSDTTLATGALLTSGSFSAQDTLVTLSLPQSYVDANAEVLTDSLDTQFEGFELRVPEGVTPGAVVAFNAALSNIVLITDEYEDGDEMTRDTLRYSFVEVYTSLERGEPTEVADRFLLRDGSSDRLNVRFDLDDFTNTPIANGGLRLPLDRSVLETGGMFFRPLLTEVALVAIYEDDTRELLLAQAIPEEGDLILRNSVLTSRLQSLLLGQIDIVAFEIAPPSTPLGLGVLPILVEEEDTPSPDNPRRPRLSLVTVGSPA